MLSVIYAMSLMLSVKYKPFRLSVVMLSSATLSGFILSCVMLSGVMLTVHRLS
jgi:hypothetical protein